MIAVIGWGSLLWDEGSLAPHIRGGWRRGDGPVLPLEFSRISAKRRMGLVLCLDAEAGTACRTSWTASVRDDLADAVADLAGRERTSPDRIGAATPAGPERARLTAIGAAVAAWCRDRGLAGAVWTDLPPNFAACAGRPFAPEAALGHLRGLAGEDLDEAIRYITRAPAETDTGFRRLLAADPWWQAECARRGLPPAPPGAGRADLTPPASRAPRGRGPRPSRR